MKCLFYLWRFFLLLGLELGLSSVMYAQEDTIRILCVGNSFSWDAVEHDLAPLCEAQGKPIQIGNLYYGGCSLEQHWQFLVKDTAAYSFRCIRRGEREVVEAFSLRQALQLQQWDYISLQQASHDSGLWDSYEPFLEALMDSIGLYQPQAQLCWMMTWAYDKDARHPDFPRYGCSQEQMRDSIMLCNQRLMERYPNLLFVPCGLAIQDVRNYLGDVVCRDGYHLNEMGQYVVSCVWFEILTKSSCMNNPYSGSINEKKQLYKLRKIVHKAVVSSYSRIKCKKNV